MVSRFQNKYLGYGHRDIDDVTLMKSFSIFIQWLVRFRPQFYSRDRHKNKSIVDVYPKNRRFA